MAQDNLDHASTAGGSDAQRPVDDHPSQAPEKGEGGTVGKHTSEPSSTHELMSGILRIVPPDTDVRNAIKTASQTQLIKAARYSPFFHFYFYFAD